MFSGKKKPPVKAKYSSDIPVLHYTAFRPYIYTYLKAGGRVNTPSSFPAALDNHAIESLSIDLNDELKRRQLKSKRKVSLSEVAGYSTQRNTARENLSTLSEDRFKCVVSDMTNQLVHRFAYVVEMYNSEYGYDDYVPLPVEAPNSLKIARGQSQERGRKGDYPSPSAPVSQELPHPRLTSTSQFPKNCQRAIA
jgi:hypothetical protein